MPFGVTGSSATAIAHYQAITRPQAQATHLLREALAESPENVTATELVNTPANTTSSSSQALKTLDEFQKKYPGVLEKAASKLDEERDALEAQRVDLVEKYNAQLAQLTEAQKLIQADIAKLTPPVTGETVHEKELREKKVESLKTTLTSITANQEKLTAWKNLTSGTSITVGAQTTLGIVVPNNPAKTQGIEQRLATAAYKLDTLAPRPRATQNPILTELSQQQIKDYFTLNLTGNQTAQQFSHTVAELQAPLLKLKELEAKMINPEISTVYRDDYIATLKQISNINERIAQQLKDDNARQLIVNAANAAGQRDQLSQLVRDLFVLQTRIDKQIGADSTRGLTTIAKHIDFNEDNISTQKLGKNLSFNWTEKTTDPTTGKPGKSKEMSLTDDKGNQIHFSLAEVKAMVAQKNQKESDVWQRGGKVGPAPKPIEVKEDWFGSGYTIRCHDAERRADFIKNTMKPAWDAKLKANQTQTATATQSNVPVPVPVSVTEASRMPASSPRNQRTTELTMDELQDAWNSNDLAGVGKIINEHSAYLKLDGCQKILAKWQKNGGPTEQASQDAKDAYKALQTAVTNLTQQADVARNGFLASFEKRQRKSNQEPDPTSLAAQV